MLSPLRSRRDYGEEKESGFFKVLNFDEMDLVPLEEIPSKRVMQKLSTCLDPLFKSIRQTLQKPEISPGDRKRIEDALRRIYSTYRSLEDR